MQIRPLWGFVLRNQMKHLSIKNRSQTPGAGLVSPGWGRGGALPACQSWLYPGPGRFSSPARMQPVPAGAASRRDGGVGRGSILPRGRSADIPVRSNLLGVRMLANPSRAGERRLLPTGMSALRWKLFESFQNPPPVALLRTGMSALRWKCQDAPGEVSCLIAPRCGFYHETHELSEAL